MTKRTICKHHFENDMQVVFKWYFDIIDTIQDFLCQLSMQLWEIIIFSLKMSSSDLIIKINTIYVSTGFTEVLNNFGRSDNDMAQSQVPIIRTVLISGGSYCSFSYCITLSIIRTVLKNMDRTVIFYHCTALPIIITVLKTKSMWFHAQLAQKILNGI